LAKETLLNIPHIILPKLSKKSFLVVFIILMAFTLFSVNKSYKTYTVLNNARLLGSESAADIRAKDTLGDLIDQYQVSVEGLVGVLGAPLPDKSSTLKRIAESRGESELSLIAKVQSLVPRSGGVPQSDDGSWSASLNKLLYEGLAVYGLPIVLAVVLLGALGLPVPAGPMTGIVGLMAFSGVFDALFAAVGILVAAFLGDVLLFELGRRMDSAWLDKHGHKFGFNEKNRHRVEHLFHRWGSMTLILSRSLVAHISAVVSLMAGASSLGRSRYWLNCLIGRLGWLLIYFGFGYFVGENLAMAGSFLGYLSLSLLGLLLIIVLFDQYYKQSHRV
jgi:membrane protein DedA with SNARE-associated domain